MIDLHTHILPGIDDGSPNAGTSMRMLRQMAVQGTQILCASPHYYADEQSIHEFCEKRDVAFEEFRQAGLGEYEDQPIVLPAAEVAFFPGISEQKELERLCIKGTHTLLLEMPFCEWNDFQIEEVTSLSLDLGYQIVLFTRSVSCSAKTTGGCWNGCRNCRLVHKSTRAVCCAGKAESRHCDCCRRPRALCLAAMRTT